MNSGDWLTVIGIAVPLVGAGIGMVVKIHVNERKAEDHRQTTDREIRDLKDATRENALRIDQAEDRVNGKLDALRTTVEGVGQTVAAAVAKIDILLSRNQ